MSPSVPTSQNRESTTGTDTPVVMRLENLGKSFGDLQAVRGVSFEVRRQEVFAFLGPNGAGKSTTIQMLCTLTEPTTGRAWIDGWDVATQADQVRRRIGLVFQEQTLDEQLTAEENLRFHAVLYGVPAAEVPAHVDRALHLVDLADRRADLVSTFSGGMARRLEIARGLLHTPTVLFLDEPTVGLDPQTRARIWEDIRRLRTTEGVTVFFSTHYMDEAEYADRIGIIDHGRIVAIDTPAALKAAVGRDVVRLRTSDDAEAATRLAADPAVRVEERDEGLVALVDDGEQAVPRLLALIDLPVQSVAVHKPTLDDVFMHFTGRQLRDEGGGEHMMSGMRRMRAARRRR